MSLSSLLEMVVFVASIGNECRLIRELEKSIDGYAVHRHLKERDTATLFKAKVLRV